VALPSSRPVSAYCFMVAISVSYDNVKKGLGLGLGTKAALTQTQAALTLTQATLTLTLALTQTLTLTNPPPTQGEATSASKAGKQAAKLAKERELAALFDEVLKQPKVPEGTPSPVLTEAIYDRSRETLTQK